MAVKQVGLSDLWTRMLADMSTYNKTGNKDYKDYAYAFYYEYKKRGGSRIIAEYERIRSNAN